MGMPQCANGGQRITLDVGLFLPPRFRQGLLFSTDVKLVGRKPSVFFLCLPSRCSRTGISDTTVPTFMWVLRFQTQGMRIAQVFLPTESSPQPSALFLKWLVVLIF